MSREPTPREKARSDRMDRHMMSALGGPNDVNVFVALYDQLMFWMTRLGRRLHARKVGRPTEDQSDVPPSFEPETNRNL